jgi:uncharacterized protein (TIGR03067 family)
MRCLISRLPQIVVGLLVLAGSVYGEEDASQSMSDAERLRGAWKVVQAKDGGRDKPNAVGQLDLFDSFRLHVISPQGRRTVYRYELEPNSNPKRMILATDDELITLTAIYKLDKGLLTLCYSYEPGVTPTDFVTKPKDGRTLLVLQRDLDH